MHFENSLLEGVTRFSKLQDFFKQDLVGLRTFVNCPFQLLPKAVAHYSQCKNRSVEQGLSGTGACFLVPDHYLPRLRHLLLSSGLECVKTYPVGSQLFTAAPISLGEPRRRVRPVGFAVHVFTDMGPLKALTVPAEQHCNEVRTDNKDSASSTNTVKPASTLLVTWVRCFGKLARALFDRSRCNKQLG